MNSWPDRRTCEACACAAKSNARAQELPIDVGLVGLDVGDQLRDEVLMPLQHRHKPVYPRLSTLDPPIAGCGGTSARRGTQQPMFRRRRQTKKLIRIARMLRELDAASIRPAAKPRRSSRVAIGRTA